MSNERSELSDYEYERKQEKPFLSVALISVVLLAAGTAGFFIGRMYFSSQNKGGYASFNEAYNAGYELGFRNADTANSFSVEAANTDVVQTTSPTAPPAKVDIPALQNPVYTTDKEPVAPFEINLPVGNEYYYIVLIDWDTKKPQVSVFLRSGTTFEFNVPLGSYYLYYASGDTWYGYDEKFGEYGSYAKADTIFDFYIEDDYYSGHTVTLYPVTNGNLDTEHVSLAEFP